MEWHSGVGAACEVGVATQGVAPQGRSGLVRWGRGLTRWVLVNLFISCLPVYLTIGGYQDFWAPVQIHVGDQATEDTVKLVTAGQKQLVLQAPLQ